MRVLIVGGGSAGWIAAATLHFRLNGGRPGPVAITLLESPQVPRIGVGEATIPTIRNMLASFGLREAEFMRGCEATIKHAIRFDDWTAPGSRYLHPFQRFFDAPAAGAVGRWLESDGALPFSDLVSAQGALIEARRAPRERAAGDYGGEIPYAYHMDAEMFAGHLATHCAARGVAHRQGHIVEVLREAKTGHVRAVRIDDGAEIAADLFIDCTGFHAVLSDPQAPGSAWIDQSNRLLCDRAVAMRVPMAPGARPQPFTRARALGAGWCWDIGLRTRRGRGYVYSSAHCSDEEAEAALRADEGASAEGIDVRIVKFRVGRRRAPWTGNVVSIGLSSGFLEPLESTGLYFASLSAKLLCEMFPPRPDLAAAPPLARGFNDVVTAVHDEVLDFIQFHYTLSPRGEPFWRDAAAPERRTDRLVHLLDLWEVRPPAFVDFREPCSPFNHINHEFILTGMGWRPAASAASGSVRLVPHPETARLVARLPGLDDDRWCG